MTDLSKTLAESEYRELDSLANATRLVTNGVCSTRVAASACSVSQSSVARVQKLKDATGLQEFVGISRFSMIYIILINIHRMFN